MRTTTGVIFCRHELNDNTIRLSLTCIDAAWFNYPQSPCTDKFMLESLIMAHDHKFDCVVDVH